jgi:hypothetical protein
MALDIRTPETIDAAWLTRALQAAGIDAVVGRIEAEPVGTGQLGDTVRFKLAYVRAAADAPATVVGKFPSASPESFSMGVQSGIYRREVMFYRHLAPGALISTPKCHLAEIDLKTDRFVLLLEDLAPATQGDQLAGVTIEQARAVVDEAAKLHASHWADDSLDELPWVLETRAAPTLVSKTSIDEVWRAFRGRYAEGLAPYVIETAEAFLDRLERYRAWRPTARCLTHYDFRPDNMMFASAPALRPVTVVDWQSVSYGSGAIDLAYFLAGALPPALRRTHEEELLVRYLAGLRRLGVEGYDAEDLRRDHALGGFRLLTTAFLAGMGVKQTARGDAMFIQMITSAVDHIIDHAAIAALG